MLDRMLEVGAGFDWISPVASIFGNIMNGPSHTFLVPYDSSPLSGREIELMLRRRGVKTWGLMVVSRSLMISVRLNQARWAQHLLEQAGVPLENPLPSHTRDRRSSASRSAHGRPRGHQKAGRRSEVGGLFDAISDVLNTSLF